MTIRSFSESTVQFPYHPTRTPHRYTVGRHIHSHHATGAYDAACTYRYTLEDYTVRSNPHVIFNRNRRRFHTLSIARRGRHRAISHTVVLLMAIRVHNQHSSSNLDITAYRHTLVYPHACAAHTHVITDNEPRLGRIKVYRSMQVAAYRVDGFTRREIEIVANRYTTPPGRPYSVCPEWCSSPHISRPWI